jgi:glycosyltransferase involved in cell wall biosynthesis
MFEYMSGGLPVIASDFPVYRKIIEAAECGLVVDPLNPAAIAEAILWLMRNPSRAAEMGRNGRRAVVEKFNWESEAKILVSIYEELLPPRPPLTAQL